MTNVVDSSGWVEYFENGTNADFFAPSILETRSLIIPTICLYEVFKRMSLAHGEDAALRAISFMVLGEVIDLSQAIAISAAQISIEHKLAMADSIILATARKHQATLWTQDEHLKDLPGVEYIDKRG
jgi:predicted nucleic acid-binding protein